MIFSIAIYAPPSAQSSDSAYRFAQALLTQGHQLYRVFFYHDAVYQGSDLVVTPRDELNKTVRWQQLAQQYDIDLVVCIAAGLQRGIIDKRESERYEKNGYNVADHFELSGLGQLVDAMVFSDRLLTFSR